ncbi:helix-turn-helix domain-containing protein [Francisella sp. TX07-6608]|uniref:helix-turn-helix domain-containing protein n=1 Tax=Francisella sp. TX07-6608 TaxID=573568 RepID=UPI0008F9CE7E|nr:S24 family peptidase [Francisella sp. TX07-6608]OIN82981.1 helix-turn-helix family protein [Francisella sp. TX07-6608]
MTSYAERLSSILSRLMQQHQITEAKLSRYTKVPQGTINRLLNKRTPDPRASTLQALANYFGVSVDDLIGNGGLDTRLNSNTIDFELLSNVTDQFKENNEKYLQEGNEVVIKLDNDAMSPIFTDETLLVFRQTEELRNREFVLAYLKNEDSVIFRQLFTENNKRILIPINKDFPNINMTDEDVILGKLTRALKNY